MLKLTILSPERRLTDQIEVESATLPGSEGQIQILPGHAAMVGTLETGLFSYVPVGGTEVKGAISTGFFEVSQDHLVVMAETSELSTEIDLSRARMAQKKAESALTDADLDPKLFRKYELKLQRALIRQQAASGSTGA